MKLKQKIAEKILGLLESWQSKKQRMYLFKPSPKKDEVGFDEWQTKVNLALDAWQKNPIAEAGIEYYVDYILGKGLQWECLIPEVSERIEKFWEVNDMTVKHKEILRTALVCGEIFIWFSPIQQIGQIPKIICIEPTEIKYIATDPEDQTEIQYYHREYISYSYPDFESNSSAGTFIPIFKRENIRAEEILHFKFGGLAILRRGRGMLYRITDYLDRYDRWLNIRLAVNKARSIFAWIFKLASNNQTEIDDWQKKLNNFAKYDRDGNMLDSIPTSQPIVIGNSMDVEAVSPQINASGAAEDGRQIKLMCAVGMKLPEFMLSDGENANLATTTSQESPMIKTMESKQEEVRLFFEKFFRKILNMLIEIGDLDEAYDIVKEDGTIETIRTVDSISLIFPEIAISDVSKLANPLNDLVSANILSRQTACTLLGYDWEEEKERIQKEKQEGFAVVKSLGFGLPAMEALQKEEIEKITNLNLNCQKELKKNYEAYRQNLLKGIPNAKSIFITEHERIVKKYLNQTSAEAYADKIPETTI